MQAISRPFHFPPLSWIFGRWIWAPFACLVSLEPAERMASGSPAEGGNIMTPDPIGGIGKVFVIQDGDNYGNFSTDLCCAQI